MTDDHAVHDALPHIWGQHVDEILDYLDAHPEHVPDRARAAIRRAALLDAVSYRVEREGGSL